MDNVNFNVVALSVIRRIWVDLIDSIQADVRAAFEKDPAARSLLEVITCYPGLQALAIHRVAHILHNYQLFWIARFLAHIARWLTGIEIHPSATIGSGIFIDHGMGVVIGETAIIGDGSLIYQGVTLGGTGKQKGKRHPTIGCNVVVGAGAMVLGDIKIGNNTRIGAGSVVLRSVPSDCTVVGVPGRVVSQAGERINPLAHDQIPDPVVDMINMLIQRVDGLEVELQQLRTCCQVNREIENFRVIPRFLQPTAMLYHSKVSKCDHFSLPYALQLKDGKELHF